MAHLDQINFINFFRNFYIKNKFKKHIDILEVGSYDVNGSIRNIFPFCNDYLGVDLAEGPNVDFVLDGDQIDTLNRKFDLIISCECFEHAKNWKSIFNKMCQISNENSFIVISVASTGRNEHGTFRSGNWQSPGTNDDYYKNLTKKDFINNFDLNKIFSNYFFFYNINSYDLYFVGIKGHANKKNLIFDINKQLKLHFKKKKIRKILVYIYSCIINEELRQNIYFFKLKLKKKLYILFNK